MHRSGPTSSTAGCPYCSFQDPWRPGPPWNLEAMSDGPRATFPRPRRLRGIPYRTTRTSLNLRIPDNLEQAGTIPLMLAATAYALERQPKGLVIVTIGLRPHGNGQSPRQHREVGPYVLQEARPGAQGLPACYRLPDRRGQVMGGEVRSRKDLPLRRRAHPLESGHLAEDVQGVLPSLPERAACRLQGDGVQALLLPSLRGAEREPSLLGRGGDG